MLTTDSNTRHQALRAALKKFADCGYEGTSVQDIVEAARVTRPTAIVQLFLAGAAAKQ